MEHVTQRTGQTFSERRSFERRSNFVSAELSAAHILIMSAELSAAHFLKMSAELSAANFLVSALMLYLNRSSIPTFCIFLRFWRKSCNLCVLQLDLPLVLLL